jgi:hypothetical protein
MEFKGMRFNYAEVNPTLRNNTHDGIVGFNEHREAIMWLTGRYDAVRWNTNLSYFNGDYNTNKVFNNTPWDSLEYAE